MVPQFSGSKSFNFLFLIHIGRVLWQGHDQVFSIFQTQFRPNGLVMLKFFPVVWSRGIDQWYFPNKKNPVHLRTPESLRFLWPLQEVVKNNGECCQLPIRLFSDRQGPITRTDARFTWATFTCSLLSGNGQAMGRGNISHYKAKMLACLL